MSLIPKHPYKDLPLSNQDRADLAVLMKDDNPIPDEMTVEQYHKRLDLVVRGYTHIRKMNFRAKWLFGKMLMGAKNKPSFYKERGFKNFTDFLLFIANKYGTVKGELYVSMNMVTTWHDLPVAVAEEVGITKLAMMTKAVDPAGNDHLEIANKLIPMSANDVKDMLSEVAHITREEYEKETIVIPATKAIRRRWNRFVNNPKIHAVVGSDFPGAALAAAMDECEAEWLARAEELEEQERNSRAIDVSVTPAEEVRTEGD